MDVIDKALALIARAPCEPSCPLNAKPYPTGPGRCPRCLASDKLRGLLLDLRADEEAER